LGVADEVLKWMIGVEIDGLRGKRRELANDDSRRGGGGRTGFVELKKRLVSHVLDVQLPVVMRVDHAFEIGKAAEMLRGEKARFSCESAS
jgi:hypothetical protein